MLKWLINLLDPIPPVETLLAQGYALPKAGRGRGLPVEDDEELGGGLGQARVPQVNPTTGYLMNEGSLMDTGGYVFGQSIGSDDDCFGSFS